MTSLERCGVATLRRVAAACACAAMVSCSGGVSTGSGDAGSGGEAGSSSGTGGGGEAGSSGGSGTCGANVPEGGACNTLSNVGPTVTQVCASGPMPIVGTGGTIADGTYVLTSAADYQSTSCSSEKISATYVIAGGCWQEVAQASSPGVSVSLVATLSVSVQGNQLTTTALCQSAQLPATATSTFTASGSTLTLFVPGKGNTSLGVQVFTKQ